MKSTLEPGFYNRVIKNNLKGYVSLIIIYLIKPLMCLKPHVP